MPVEVFSVPERTYNNRTLTYNAERLIDRIDVSTLGSVRTEFNVVSVDTGGMWFEAFLNNGVGDTTRIYREFFEPGQYVIAFNRGDIDELTELRATFFADGRAGIVVYLYARGEDVPG